MASTKRSGRAFEIERLGLAANRTRNLRQRLVRAHRAMNEHVSAELIRRGYDDVRLVHARLLENLDRAGNSISVVAKRGQMTKQAMGALARELESKGYVRRVADDVDGRAWRVCFTDRGWRLMLEAFEIVAELERHIATEIGRARVGALEAGLDAIEAIEGRNEHI
ncbi:MAG: hypothetical protein NVS2B3_04970 [Vulcanimicrobiaceae bacterium]